eukprot:1578389-Rhodomonas_salina.2
MKRGRRIMQTVSETEPLNASNILGLRKRRGRGRQNWRKELGSTCAAACTGEGAQHSLVIPAQDFLESFEVTVWDRGSCRVRRRYREVHGGLEKVVEDQLQPQHTISFLRPFPASYVYFCSARFPPVPAAFISISPSFVSSSTSESLSTKCFERERERERPETRAEAASANSEGQKIKEGRGGAEREFHLRGKMEKIDASLPRVVGARHQAKHPGPTQVSTEQNKTLAAA